MYLYDYVNGTEFTPITNNILKLSIHRATCTRDPGGLSSYCGWRNAEDAVAVGLLARASLLP